MANYKDIKYQFPAESLISGSVANARVSAGSVTQHVQPYISWQSVVTTNTTVVAGRGYPVNTSGGALTMTLPASPSVGDTLKFMDYGRTFNTNQLTLGRNGSNFQGNASDAQFNIAGSTITVTYIDATKGWVPTTDDDVIIFEAAGNQQYTSAGNYTWTVPSGVTTAHVVCIGAGGSGGKGNSGQAGGGAALAYRNSITVVGGQTATITVGAQNAQSGNSGQSGGSSSFTYGGSATTGGGGGGGYGDGTQSAGTGGGSGGTQQGVYTAGGSGGSGGTDPSNYGGPGGGGAGGYSGNGGAGRSPTSGGDTTTGAAGSGGGGGGGGKGGQSERGGGGGGGVGILGLGTNGAGGTSQGSNASDAGGGGGGSGGTAGSSGTSLHGGSGGTYGGGHGGSQSEGTQGTGGPGAVRIIWGTGRSFPSNASLV